MKKHLKRWLIAFLCVHLLFQNIFVPMPLDAGTTATAFTNSEEKAGTVENTKELLEPYEEESSQMDASEAAEGDTALKEPGSTQEERTEYEEGKMDHSGLGEDTEEGPGEETEKDTGEETEKDTGEDTEKDTGEDTEKDTGEDTEKDTGEDTGKDTEEDTEKDTGEDTEKDTDEIIISEDSEESYSRQRSLQASTRANHSCNMPKATYETFILQGKEGKGQKIGNSGKVTMLANRKAIQNDITANHKEYVSFTPHWGADTSAALSSQAGSRKVSYYVNDPKKAQHVGSIGQAAMSPNIIGGRVFKLDASMKNKLSCTYYNVGRYYDRASGRSYAVDMKAVLVDFTKKPKNTEDVQNAIADGAMEEDNGPLFCFIGVQSIGVLTTFCDAVTIRYSFYIHGSGTAIDVKGFARFGDVDAQQGIEFSQEADYFYAINDANQYLGYSKGVYGDGNKAYIYSLSSKAVKDNPGSAFYTLFSGSQMTLRYTFAKCSRQDDGGDNNGNNLTKYKVPFDNSDVKDYSTSSSSGYIHFDAKQPYLAQPEINKYVFNGNDIQAEVQTPHTAVSNALPEAESLFTYKIRTVCPYEDASQHHYSSWIIKDQVSPFLHVEQAVLYDGTGNRSSDFRIQIQEQTDGSTIVTATASNPAAQTFYEKNWYDLYITVRVKSRQQLENLSLDFTRQYVSSGNQIGKYVLENHAVLSTGTDYTSNKVQTIVPQKIKIRKVNEEGTPVEGVTFGIFTAPDADAEKDKPLMTAVTGEDGIACFKAVSFYNLAGKEGPYYIREISRGAYENVYLLDETWNYSFSSNKGNPVIFGEEKETGIPTLEDIAKVLRKYTVLIRKKNRETSEFLKGAVFSLYQWSETGKSYTKVCNLEETIDKEGQYYYRNTEDIIATEDNLGRFMVKEEQAPYGCYNAGKTWTFETTDAYVEDENTITFLYTAENGTKKTQTGQLLYVNELQKGVIHLVKTDETQACVEGASFVIKAAEDIYAPWQYEEDGSVDPRQEPLVPRNTVCGYLKTDENGSAVSKPLYIGTYLVQEIGGAPDHVMSEEIYEVKFTYPDKDDTAIVEENVQAGNVIMRPSFAVAKLAERTRNPEGQEVVFDAGTGRYCEEKIPGAYQAKEVIRYHITVTNTGNTDLYHIRLSDTMEEENAAGQKLSDYVDKDRAAFIVPETESYETERGEHITVSFVGDDKKEILLSKLREGDSVTVFFDAPVADAAANVYDLINKVSGSASYDNNEAQPGQHLIPVNTKELVDEEGNLLTEDEDRIHIPGIPDDSVIKMADRTTGAVVTEGELSGVKVPGLYYEGDTVCFAIHVKNTGTANLKDIVVTDVMSEELKQIVDVETASFRWKEQTEEKPEKLLTNKGEEISVRQIDASRVILCENTDAATGAGCLRPGDSATLYFYAEVKKDAANLYDLQNTAVVNASYFNGERDIPVPEKNDTDQIELPGVPEAKLAKIADRTTGAILVDGRYQNEKITGTYNNGDKINFTITVTNSGSADLYDLKVTDVMEERLLSALVKNSIRFQDGVYTTAKQDTLTTAAQKGPVLLLNRLKAGDSVDLLLQATVNEQAGDLFKLENKVYVTGHYRKGNEQYQQQYEQSAQAAGHSYLLQYHANNGTEEKTADSETPAHKGDTVTINGNPFQKEASQFLGWNTKADGTGEDYAPGSEYRMPAQDVHLYARWGQKGTVLKKNYAYALTYHSNNPLSQSYPDSETRCAAGTAVLLDENQFRYQGYRFIGWSLTPEKKEELLQPGESYRMPKKDMHLYAQWEKEERVTLTYHCNIPDREQKKTDFQTPCKKGETVTVKQCEFERQDYMFVGWSKEKGGTNVEIHPQEILTLDRNIDLYAVWQKEKDGKEEIKYALTYHGNNETNDSFMDSKTPCPEGETIVLASNLFTYDGYTFIGWNTKADGTGKSWEEKDIYTMPDRNVHLYAQWQKAAQYKLTYISNYPDTADASVDEKKTDSETPCLEQSAVHIDGCSFQCDGYQFAGWSLSAEGSTSLIRPGAEYVLSQDTELYAIWTDDCEQYTLLYCSNTETPIWEAAPDSPSPAGTPQTLIKNPFSNTAAAFAGWSLEENATPQSETLLKPGQYFEQPAKDTVLYAVWEKGESRNLYYDGNGGKNASAADGKIMDEETPCMPGTGIRMDPCTFQKEGFRFLGWSTEKIEPWKEEQAMQQIEILYPGCAYTMPDEDITLFAVWEEVPKTTFTEDNAGQDADQLAQSEYTPIPVTQLMKDNDFVHIPGQPDLRVAKKADRTKGITLKKGRYQGERKPGVYYEGDRVVYTITVSNYGTATASQLTIREKPSAAWKNAMTPEGFTAFEGETLETAKGNPIRVQKKTADTLTLDNLKPGDSVTLTYEAVVKTAKAERSSIKNTVKVTAYNQEGLPITETKYMTDKDAVYIVEKEQSSSSRTDDVPKTGDNSKVSFWIIAGVCSTITIGLIIFRKKRK